MFVQATKSKRKGKTYVTYLVRESFRTADGPRSRTVCNITDLPPALRDLIAAGLRGQNFLPAEQAQLEAALDYGGLAVLQGRLVPLPAGRIICGDRFGPPAWPAPSHHFQPAALSLRQAVPGPTSPRHLAAASLRVGGDGNL